MGYGLYMGHILSLLTYLLTTSVSGRVLGYPSYYPTGIQVINYPDAAELHVVTPLSESIKLLGNRKTANIIEKNFSL